MDFLYYLAKNGANVSMPIYTINKQLVEQIDCHDGSNFIVCAFTKAERRKRLLGKAQPISSITTMEKPLLCFIT